MKEEGAGVCYGLMVRLQFGVCMFLKLRPLTRLIIIAVNFKHLDPFRFPQAVSYRHTNFPANNSLERRAGYQDSCKVNL